MFRELIVSVIVLLVVMVGLSTAFSVSENNIVCVHTKGFDMFGTVNSPISSEDVDMYTVVRNDLPDAWDWRDVNGVDWTTPIRNQLQDVCGSCWAFGALGGLESMLKIWMNDSSAQVDLSEQYMLSCSPGSCNGWYWLSTLRWILDHGAIPESCLSYSADDSIPCDAKCDDWYEHLVGIEHYHKVYANVSVIQSALVSYGPLPATMNVYSDFYPDYSGGVYQQNSDDFVFGHCVTIVGYNDSWGDTDGGYWIVKNSWGTDWGEDGWFRIAYGECKIENSVYYYTAPNYSVGKPAAPVGPNRGGMDREYTFTAVGVDPDNDTIRYIFDWDEGNSTLSEYVKSGGSVACNYSWSEQGDYAVRVKIEDEHGLESAWSDPAVISIPKNRPNSFDWRTLHLWLMHFKNHPNATVLI